MNKPLAITIVVILIVVLLAVVAKKYFMPKNYNEKDAVEGLAAVRSKYGVQMASIIEKMYRLETNHFKSEQYKRTGTGGMEAGKWQELPALGYKIKDLPTIAMHDANTADGEDLFIVFPSVKDAMFYKAEYILRYDGNYARWYSLDSGAQQNYMASLANISTPITNNLA